MQVEPLDIHLDVDEVNFGVIITLTDAAQYLTPCGADAALQRLITKAQDGDTKLAELMITSIRVSYYTPPTPSPKPTPATAQSPPTLPFINPPKAPSSIATSEWVIVVGIMIGLCVVGVLCWCCYRIKRRRSLERDSQRERILRGKSALVDFPNLSPPVEEELGPTVRTPSAIASPVQPSDTRNSVYETRTDPPPVPKPGPPSKPQNPDLRDYSDHEVEDRPNSRMIVIPSQNVRPPSSIRSHDATADGVEDRMLAPSVRETTALAMDGVDTEGYGGALDVVLMNDGGSSELSTVVEGKVQPMEVEMEEVTNPRAEEDEEKEKEEGEADAEEAEEEEEEVEKKAEKRFSFSAPNGESAEFSLEIGDF